jgi:hypothetical protein
MNEVGFRESCGLNEPLSRTTRGVNREWQMQVAQPAILDLARPSPPLVGPSGGTRADGRLPRQRGTRSFACDLDRCLECDGLVHWEPIGRNGRDFSRIAETERPRDLRPWRCDCKCHADGGRE